MNQIMEMSKPIEVVTIEDEDDEAEIQQDHPEVITLDEAEIQQEPEVITLDEAEIQPEPEVITLDD